jgi:hypothetical protein
VPYIDAAGEWRNANVCGCTTDCSCGELCEIALEAPVYDVVSVLEDGVVLPAGAYRVDVPGRLVRTDGGCWPDCQDMAAPCGDAGTLCVTYRMGLPLDAAAIAAVSELTCQLVAACLPAGTKGCGECRLPGNVRRVVRQGVQVDMADPTTLFRDGRTGLTITDAWLATVNPHNAVSPGRVYSPDYRRARSRIWP